MKRSAPLKPGKPLQRSGKRLRSGRSTGTPNKAEAARIVAVKEGPCVACWNWESAPITFGCDAHHLLSGGRRIGHMAVLGLCPWHHRGYVPPGYTAPEMREVYGPSLMDGSKRFRDAYGTDAELMEVQNKLLGGDA